MKIKICIFFLLLGCFESFSQSKLYKLYSPNKKIQLNISNKENASLISAVFIGDTIIKPSVLGLKNNSTDFTSNVSYSNFSETTFDDTWKTVNGKYLTVRNHYNEYRFTVSKLNNKEQHYEIIFRLYDEGFAYQYNFPTDAIKDNVLIEKELTHLNFNNDFTYWAYNGETHNLGPILRSKKNIEDIKIPAVMQLNNKRFMAIHEAEILSFAPFTLNASANDLSLKFNTEYSSREKAFKTSWRAFILGEKVGDLVESNLLVNLNEPCKIEDTSWIKPGKSTWDWRVWGYKAKDGFQYELDTKSHKRLIDFASKNNVQYLLIDADWYGEEFNENSDPTTAKDGVDIEEAMRYAKERNVGIILYLNDVGAKKFGLERVLKQFSDWGAVGVKYGFMTGSLEDKVKQTKKVIELCAQNKLMVDFHDGPIPPNGDRRTWPNMMAKEFGHAQADALRSHFPETSVNQVLINMIAGPLDLTNGWFDLNDAFTEKRPKVFQELPGTVVAEVAKLITIYTGWSVLPDSPEEYLDKDDLFDCIRKMPAQFDSFKILDAELDAFVSVARKAGDDWFIGSLTTREPREITVNLNFLPKDKKYEATIYSDLEDSHFLNNKESYKIDTQAVNSNSKLNIKMAPGGGNAIYIRDITGL